MTSSSALHAAGIRRNDHKISGVGARAERISDEIEQHWAGKKVVERNIEKTLDLPAVKIHRNHSAHPCSSEQIGHKLGSDRSAGMNFTILAGITVVRNHCSDRRHRSPLERVYHDEQFHQVIVHRVTGGLNDEAISPANVVLEPDSNLPI